MPDPVVPQPAEIKAVLDSLSKIRIDVGLALDLPFLKPIMDYASNVRTTMDKKFLDRLDDVFVTSVEDSYSIYRKALVDLRILPK